ncbi:MAG: hypothetical protein IKO73_08135 [Bacteroidaceae bacterium]|nr:hypothetical protein [Bacteroidaceae bacterium]
MKQKFFFVAATLAASLGVISCGTQKLPDDMEMPIAVNTINSVGLKELNLQHGTDYSILNTVSAEAAVFFTSHKKGRHISIEEENGEFEIEWKKENGSKLYRFDYKGVARFGFLNNDYGRVFTDVVAPEYIVRNLAIYRLINLAKVRGADGVIEPVVSTSAEDKGDKIVFRTTVTAKLMKLNADAK